MVRVRAEMPCDAGPVQDLLRQAFPSDAESGLVDVLRGRTDPQIALVAEHEGRGIIGQILFTPVEIRSGSTTSRAMGLGPMGVLPPLQRQGVGKALVEAGLSACRAAGELVVVVLGHPSYYSCFAFRPAWDHGLYYKVPGPNPAFMVRELEDGALRGRSGEVLYHEAFDGV